MGARNWRAPASRTAEYPTGTATLAGGMELLAAASCRLADALDPASYGSTSWIGGAGQVLRLHPPPAPDSDRVRAWRKRARDGTLPPILVTFARGMGLWLMLDGHDRLRAALDEGVSVPVLHLFVGSYQPHGTPAVHPEMGASWVVQRDARREAAALVRPSVQLDMLQNRILDEADWDELVPSTYAWPIAGGYTRWREEVDDRIARFELPATRSPEILKGWGSSEASSRAIARTTVREK